MANACPHCKAEIPGMIEQSVHTERLNLKQAALDHRNEEYEALKQKLEQATPRLREVDALTAKIATLEGDLEKQKGSAAKALAAAKAGLNPDKMRLAETAYEMAHETVDAAKRPAFTDWLVAEDGAKSNPDIRHLFAAAQAAAGTPPIPGSPPVPKKDAPPPTAPPGGNQKPTPAQIDAYFKSPEFKAMKREDQHKKVAELQAQVAAAPGQDGRT